MVPSQPLPPPRFEFVQAVAACCCLIFFRFPVLQFCMARQAASPPIPSLLPFSAHVPAAARIALAAPCVPLATATHIVFGIACVVTVVCMRAGTRSVLLPKQQ